MRQWRLIYDHPSTGAYNMAVDEAILRAVSAGKQPPTLRLYEWDPFCISLGYGQSVGDVDAVRLSALGWHLVRRPTGGRAILHGDELTYSVALPITHELAHGDVIASYRRLSTALLTALKRLGLIPQSERQAAGASRNRGAVCFEVPSHYEITIEGRKLIGSAQLRRKAGILQHGTLPLFGDVARICDVLSYSNEEQRETTRRTVRERATTLAQALNRSVDWNEVAESIVAGFQATFDLELIAGELSPKEQTIAEELMESVYARHNWTAKC